MIIPYLNVHISRNKYLPMPSYETENKAVELKVQIFQISTKMVLTTVISFTILSKPDFHGLLQAAIKLGGFFK